MKLRLRIPESCGQQAETRQAAVAPLAPLEAPVALESLHMYLGPVAPELPLLMPVAPAMAGEACFVAQ